MVPGTPLFKYEGAATNSCTISPSSQDKLYRIEMELFSPPNFKMVSPNTVLLYATFQPLQNVPERRGPILNIQQPRNRRRFTVSWKDKYILANTFKLLYMIN